MRKIKFRGYNRKNKQWLYGFYLQNRGAHFVCPDEFATGKSWDDYEIDPNTLGQFTGLKDMNGKEIYEGDAYVLHSLFISYEHPLRVGYRDGSWIGFADDGSWITLIKDADTPYQDKLPYIEVVGNIYDNPKLLKIPI